MNMYPGVANINLPTLPSLSSKRNFKAQKWVIDSQVYHVCGVRAGAIITV